jgi:NAD(P)-dependent dehydrogenase (short-subunit alcohol dehydrogenase family)
MNEDVWRAPCVPPRRKDAMSEIRFDGRVAVITGAGGGLGKTYALQLGERGAQLVVNDLGGSADGTGAGTSMADQTVKEITEAGGNAVANYDSVATPEGGDAIIKAALDQFGRVDIVINNAGILRDKTFAKLPPEDLEVVLDVHLKGAFFVSQPAFRHMKEQGYGRFIFTTSAAGLLGNFGQTNYGAAKMGLVGLSNVLALEGAKYDIRSNVIAPLARTRMTEQLLGPMAEALDPEYVTPLVTYLASEQCDLTHQVFSVGGGRFARMFVGLTRGWYAGKGKISVPEDVRDHIDEIRNPDGYIIPDSVADEFKLMLELTKG